jgi:hypothetical protein
VRRQKLELGQESIRVCARIYGMQECRKTESRQNETAKRRRRFLQDVTKRVAIQMLSCVKGSSSFVQVGNGGEIADAEKAHSGDQ